METAWVFFMEAGVALGLLIFIVWWTLLSTPDRAKRPPPQTADRTNTPNLADHADHVATGQQAHRHEAPHSSTAAGAKTPGENTQ